MSEGLREQLLRVAAEANCGELREMLKRAKELRKRKTLPPEVIAALDRVFAIAFLAYALRCLRR